MNNKDASLDDLLKDFDASEIQPETEQGKPVSMWFPESRKAQFDRLQDQTKKKFGKKIREMIFVAMDKIDKEKAS